VASWRDLVATGRQVGVQLIGRRGIVGSHDFTQAEFGEQRSDFLATVNTE
jgi:hypothetical protein